MMAGIRSKNTKPEVLVRKMLHSSGYRFRLHVATLPGKPDIVLPKYKTAIFVNGCFWHGHEKCHLFCLPKSRTEFWQAKIAGNILRDRLKQQNLNTLGWRTISVWECALKGKKSLSVQTLTQMLTLKISGSTFICDEISGE